MRTAVQPPLVLQAPARHGTALAQSANLANRHGTPIAKKPRKPQVSGAREYGKRVHGKRVRRTGIRRSRALQPQLVLQVPSPARTPNHTQSRGATERAEDEQDGASSTRARRSENTSMPHPNHVYSCTSHDLLACATPSQGQPPLKSASAQQCAPA